MESEAQQQTTQVPQQIQVFEKFEAYNFENDVTFQTGLQSIITSNKEKPENEQHDAIQNAKLFYFARFVEPLDINQYKSWHARNESVSESAVSADAVTAEASQASNQAADPSYPKSFQEICDLIAAGKPIPGIRQIPSNLAEGTPSEAKLQPKPKPWEKKVASTASAASASESTVLSSE
ncbi:hypothetical protein BGZ76_000530 [Entomortierella beljakovae]|nr:hypothetical protein BGZ76_000530 [Entomortierella beljakovae]